MEINIIITLASTTLIIYLSYWYLLFIKLLNINPITSDHTLKRVSVIICARNEKQNLIENIPSLLTQNYPDFEVIVMDDFSSDGSSTIMSRLKQANHQLYYHKVTKNVPGKKQALIEGVAKATSSYVLLTDADCKPSNKHWLKTMIRAALPNKSDLVIGYAPFYKQRSFLNKWTRFENWISALQYLSFAVVGKPYMGVGRNILYKKSAFKIEVLLQNMDLSSGDDDLMVNKIANHNNTVICINKEAFMYSHTKGSWKEYIHQKMRHLSTAHKYKISDILRLSIFSLSHFIFYSSIILLVFYGHFFVAGMFYLLRLILIWPLAIRLLELLDEKDLKFLFPLFDIMFFVFYLFFSFSVIFPKKKSW